MTDSLSFGALRASRWRRRSGTRRTKAIQVRPRQPAAPVRCVAVASEFVRRDWHIRAEVSNTPRDILSASSKRESGGTGRRAGFRCQWGNPWGFESPLSHQLHAHRVGRRRNPTSPVELDDVTRGNGLRQLDASSDAMPPRSWRGAARFSARGGETKLGAPKVRLSVPTVVPRLEHDLVQWAGYDAAAILGCMHEGVHLEG